VTPATAAVDFEAEPILTPAGHRLLDAASALFYGRGIRAVGVDLIAEEAGTTKKTLYDCFGSKDALVALYLRRRAIRWQEFLRSRLDDPAGDAGDRLRRVFDALEEWHESGERGCAFVNAYAEVGSANDPAVAVIRAEKQWMHDLFLRLPVRPAPPTPTPRATCSTSSTREPWSRPLRVATPARSAGRARRSPTYWCDLRRAERFV